MRWGELLAAVGKRQAQERADKSGNGLEGVFMVAFGRDADIPGWVRLMLPPGLDRELLAGYLGPKAKVAVIAAPAVAEVSWSVWQPQAGPPVRRITNLLQLGAPTEHLVLSHLLAYGAGDLLDPPEPVVDRGLIR